MLPVSKARHIGTRNLVAFCLRSVALKPLQESRIEPSDAPLQGLAEQARSAALAEGLPRQFPGREPVRDLHLPPPAEVVQYLLRRQVGPLRVAQVPLPRAPEAAQPWQPG